MSRRGSPRLASFVKFDQRVGQHQLTQQVNYTDSDDKNFLPLSAASSLPSARNDSDTSRLLLAFGDTALLGNPGNPYVLTLRGAFRSEDSETLPSQTDLTGATPYNPYDSRCTISDLHHFRQSPDRLLRQSFEPRPISISNTRRSTAASTSSLAATI